MKTIGILFDVSGSMHEKFENMNKLKEINKKSDQLIQILKNICKNSQLNIFTILFGLYEPPYIIDFIRLLKISNQKFKVLKCNDTKNSNNCFRKQLIKYLSEDQNGNKRYCEIEKYVLSPNGPSEQISEFFCKAMEEENEIVDIIYDSLPKEVTNKDENESLNNKIKSYEDSYKYIPFSKKIVDKKVKNFEKGEIIKATKSSFGKCIEIMTTKIMNKYKEENKEEIDLITGQELSELIEEMKKKIIQPKDENFNIIDIFENYIYGDTPLYTSCMKAFSTFQKNNNNKILLIISDGLLNDNKDIEKAQNDIKNKIEELQIITVGIFLNSSKNYNNKTFYNQIQENFNEGEKFLFNISSKLDYHNNIIKFFVKKNWTIPLNGVCNLFIEINNSKDLNQFIELLNESLEYKDSLQQLVPINSIIREAFLDKIIEENYLKQFEAEDQTTNPICWQYSISEAIYLASVRVFGRKIESFKNIMDTVGKIKNKYYGDKLVNPNNFFEIVEKIVKNFKLRARKVTPDEARIAIMKGRQCLCYIYFTGEQKQKFNQFFKDDNTKKGIITKDNLKKSKKDEISKVFGHVVLLTSIEEKCLKLLNSYGKNWGDEGYFRIKDEKVLKGLKESLVEIYWKESDLSKEEINIFNNNFLPFIQQASKYLSQPNINVKNDLQKEFECPKCKKKFKLDNFKLILNQKHNKNDDTDVRKLKIKCHPQRIRGSGM